MIGRLRLAGDYIRDNPGLIGASIAQGALSAGLSAYGNVSQENDRSKGDQRMILESIMAALGSGVSGGIARHMMSKRYSAPAVQLGKLFLAAKDPQRLAALRTAFKDNPLLRHTSPEGLMTLAGATLGSAVGAGIGGAALAPAIADQLGVVLAPGDWTRRANDWNWDRQIAMEQAIADRVLAGMATSAAQEREQLERGS